MSAARIAARRGMTLIEILVAVMIFTVVGLAMVSILIAGTEVFRQGEYGRGTTDATIVALAALEDDLDRAVPEASGGVLRAVVDDASGNCTLAFKIERKDPLRVDKKGYGQRMMVAWRARYDASRDVDVLERTEHLAYDSMSPDDFATYAAVYAPGAKQTDPDCIPYSLPADDARWRPVVDGCLHFSCWLDGTTAKPRDHAAATIDWEVDGDNIPLPPMPLPAPPGSPIEYVAPLANAPLPSSLRIVLAMTGGSRFAPAGTLIKDDSSSMRIAGVKGVSTLPGALLLVGDAKGGNDTREWIAYGGYANGVLDTSNAGARGALRSAPVAHARGQPVRLAQISTIVRPFGR